MYWHWHSIHNALPEEQYPIVMKRGINDYNKEITYYFNYQDEPATITWHGKDAMLLMQNELIKDGDVVTIEGWNFRIIEEQ